MAEDIGGMIEKAMADPRFGEIFGMLKEKADKGELDVSNVGSLLGGSSDVKESGKQVGTQKEKMGAEGRKGGKFDFAKHEKLLCALKPYLSDNKRNAVDTVVKAAKLGDILEALNGKDK